MTLPAAIPLPRSEALALRAALYGRASSDPKKRGRSIKDQFAVGELECLDRGWSIVGRYEDRDRSASRRARKVREDWERLIADVEAGKIDVIVYAERSRASRDMEVSMKLRRLCEDTGALLFYDGRVYNMRKPSDRKEFTRDAVASEEEAETTIERAERTARLNAARGAPHGKVPFGFLRRYDPDDGHLLGQFAHPEYSAVVIDVFERADRGESFSSLVKLMAKYVPLIDRYGLRYILKNRAYIGQRLHKGKYTKATWDGFVPEDLFWRVQAIVSSPGRRTQRDTRAKHLASGIGTCYRCLVEDPRHAGLVRRPPRAKPGTQTVVPMPASPPKPGKKRARQSEKVDYGCPKGHVSVGMLVLDAYIEEALLCWFQSPKAGPAFAPLPDGDEERARQRMLLESLRAQLDEAREMAAVFDERGRPGLSVQSLAELERRVLPLIATAEQRIQQLVAVGDPLIDQLLAAPGPERIAAVWNAFQVSQRRHVLRRSMNVILNKASTKGVRKLEEGRVTLVFLGEPDFRLPGDGHSDLAQRGAPAALPSGG